jgi:hypothetical protein
MVAIRVIIVNTFERVQVSQGTHPGNNNVSNTWGDEQ